MDETAVIDKERCIGCGQCLAMCRFDAVLYNWRTPHEDLQKKIVEHAMGVHSLFNDKSLYINVATRVSKDCDCGGDSFEKIVPDVGILVSRDPVAVDAATLDAINKVKPNLFKEINKVDPYKQILFWEKIGLGSSKYELISI